MNNIMGESVPKCKETEQAFKELSDKYRRLQANIPGMVYQFTLHADGSYSFLYVNAASRELFDIDPDDLMQKWTLISDLIHPDDRDRFEKSLNQSAKTLLPWREQLRHIVNGEVRWYDCMSRPELQSNGDILWDGIILEITDQMKAAESLRESEQKLSDIISASPVGIAIYDGSGQCIAANDSFAQIIGATKQQVLKQNYGKIESWKKSGLLDMAQTAVRTQSVKRHEVVTTSSFGKEVFLDCHLVPFGAKGLLFMIQDITERKLTEVALIEKDRFLTSIIDQNPYPIWISDEKGILIRINQACKDLLGIREDEVLGKYNVLEDNIVQEQGFLPLLQSVYDKGEVVNFTIDYDSARLKQLQLDRTKRLILDVTVSPITDENGSITNAVIIHHDITDRKIAEEALQESEERFRSTFEQAAVGIAHVGLGGTWLRVNQRLCDIVGYSREAMMNLTFQEITYPDDLEADVDHIRQMIAGKIQTYAMEKRYIRKNGSLIWINLTVSLVRHMSGEPKHFISVIEDISARKDAKKAQQAHLQLLMSMEQIDQAVRSATDLDQMMIDVLDVVLSIFGCDRAFLLYPCDPDSPSWRVPMERTVPEYPGAEVLNMEIPMQPWVAEILQNVIASDGAVKFGPQEENPVPSEGRAQFQIQSIIQMAVYPKGDKPWAFGLHQCSFARIWSADEKTLLQEIGRRIADSLNSLLAFRNLQKSEDRFRTLVENIPGFVYRCELKVPWRLLYVSEAAFDLTGYPARDFVENQTIHFGELVLPEDLPMVERVVNQSIKNRVPYEITYRIRHASGGIRWVYEKGRATYDEDGTPVWLDGVIVDITERELTNEALKESEATLRSIYESSPMLMGIVELTVDDKIVHIYDNPATARFFNVEYKGTKNRVADELGAPSEAISEWLVRYRQSQQEGKPVRFEYIHPAPGGPRWLSATVSIIGPGHNGRIRFSYVAEDITGRKQGEKQLQEYAETQAVLLQEVNHRVKNNLAAIISMLHKEEDQATSKGFTYFPPLLNDLTRRIEGLITVHSMFSASNWEPLSLSQLCEQIVKGVLKSHTENIKLNISPSDIQVDSNQAHHLTLVINELATNSIKYAFTETSRPRIDIDITEANGEICLIFRDNGAGFPENIIRSEYGETGIGFDIINGIVKKSLRGSISLKNEDGAVSKITFNKAPSKE
ncbi:MAG: PAS domain S-box protein [Desulfobacterales bacterium]|nr:PAS domain S-box protein [Desulfobacterales bacterium]